MFTTQKDHEAMSYTIEKLEPEPTTRKVTDRDPSKVDTIMLQQAGFLPRNHLRYKRAPVHFLVMPDGRIFQIYAIGKRLPTAYGFNDRCVSIMFAGNFPCVAGSENLAHFYRPAQFGQSQLAVEQAGAGRWLVRTLLEHHEAGAGAQFEWIAAMIQARASHHNNPGPDVWAAVGAYGVGLGLRVAPSREDGRLIPSGWWDGHGAWDIAVCGEEP